MERMHVISETETPKGTVVNVNTWEIMASSWAASVMGWYLRGTFQEVCFPAWLGGLKEYAKSC